MGYLLLLVGSAAILSWDGENFQFFGWNFQRGGVVGYLFFEQIKRYLNPPGTHILLVVMLLVGLILISRVSLARLAERFQLWLYAQVGVWRDGYQKNRERRRKAKVLTAGKELQKERESKPPVIVQNPVVKAPPAPKITAQQEQFVFMKDLGDYTLPPLSLLDDVEKKDQQIQQQSLIMNSRLLEKKLKDFGVEGQVLEVSPGPVITMYEFEPAPGVKISRITGLADDLAMAMRAVSIRIVAPLPGKAVIGIEIPNVPRETVGLKEILASPAFAGSKSKLTIALGKDIMGIPVANNLARMPHLMIAGATGTGQERFPERHDLQHSFQSPAGGGPFSDHRPQTDRTAALRGNPPPAPRSGHRTQDGHPGPALGHPGDGRPISANGRKRGPAASIPTTRRLLKEKKGTPRGYPEGWLPYIIVIIDELADLMMVSSRDVEEYLTRLAQMARAAGIHLLIATQRPSVDVLTGIIKANFPTRISFQVSSKTDSRTILDTNGAEALLGAGDMLFLPPGVSKLQRIHGAYVSETEIKRLTDFLRNQKKPVYDDSILTIEENLGRRRRRTTLDEKYEEAVRLVKETRQVSISMIQRKLRIGYNRAARLVEIMEREGDRRLRRTEVGHREVLVKNF